MATNPSISAEEDQSLRVRFLTWVQETLSCPILVLKMQEKSGQNGEGHKEDHENHQRDGQWGQWRKAEGIFPWRKEDSVATSPKRVVRRRMKVLFSTRIHNWRIQGWQVAPGEGSSWYKKEIFLEWEQPFMGRTSLEGWCGPYSGEVFKRWLDRVWDKLIVAPFLMKGWTNLPFKVTSSLGCWFCELHSLLQGISHLPLVMERIQGESSLQR